MIHANGGTEIRHGLDAGLFELRRTFSRSAINHLLLLTDGRTYGDETASLNLADQAGLLGIGITALGLGEEWNDSFLDDLAARTGGTSMYIDHPRALKQFFQEKLIGLGNIYAQQVELHWQAPAENQLRYAFRLQPDPSPLPITSPLRLGSIPQDGPLEILVEIQLPPLSPNHTDMTLLVGELTFQLPRDPDERVHRLPLTLARPIDPAAPISDVAPRPVFQAAQQVSLYRLQERARADAQNGSVEAASRRLLHLATHLLYQGSRSLAQAVLVEADHLQQNQIFSVKGEKRIKYGTRALALPEPPLDDNEAAR
jgi:Ca-activated chloride channel family protein